MSNGGKGSKPRPFSISQQEYETRWDAIFGRDLEKNDYQDVLSTEDCVIDAFEKMQNENTSNQSIK